MMSEILDRVVESAKRGEWYPLTDGETLELTHCLLNEVQDIESFLNGVGEMIFFDERTRYGLHALDHLTLEGCPYYHDAKYCGGDLAILNKDSVRGRCCKCGEWVTDYRW